LKSGRSIALAALSSAAVGIVGPGAAAAKTVEPGVHDFGPAFVLKGQTLRVKVRPATSGSTGYHWRARYKQRRVLRLKSQHISRNGKWQVFTFKGRRAGNAYLHLLYVPPGRHRKPAKRVKVGVGVNRRFHAPGCRPKGSRTVVQNSKARVFTLRRAIFVPSGGQSRWAFRGYFGCTFARNRAFGFDGAGSDDPEKSIPSETRVYMFPILRGTKFGQAFRTRGSQFRAYPDVVNLVRTFDLRKRKVIRRAYPAHPFPGSNSGVLDLVMSARGGLAWTEDDPDHRDGAIVSRSDQPPQHAGGVAGDRTVLDADENGDVDPESLQLDGGDVTWLRGGTVRRAPLR
jgi:hypothetical protein